MGVIVWRVRRPAIRAQLRSRCSTSALDGVAEILHGLANLTLDGAESFPHFTTRFVNGTFILEVGVVGGPPYGLLDLPLELLRLAGYFILVGHRFSPAR